MKLFKWGMCTEEIAVDIITLLEPAMNPFLKRHVLNVLAKDLGRFPSNENPTPRDLKNVEFGVDQQSMSDKGNGNSNGEKPIDYRYIEVKINGSLKDLACSISSFLNMQVRLFN